MCIRSGYTYVYEQKTDSGITTTVRDISSATADYGGKCALKNFDGTYTYDKTTTVDLSKALLSDAFTLDIALANCPAKQSVCGKKAINQAGFATPAVDLAVTKLNSAKDSCHWVIKASCDLPEITLKPTYRPTVTTTTTTVPFTLTFLEFSEKALGADTKTQLDGAYPLAGMKTKYIDDYQSFFPGSLPDVMLKNNKSVLFKYPAYLVEDDIKAKTNAYKDYNASLAQYKLDVDTWNIAMTNSAKYNANLKNWTETVDFFTCLFGCAFAEERPKIPKEPVKPVRPLPYKGQVEKNFTYIEGYGVPTSGLLYPFSRDKLSSLNKKYFGVLGQGYKPGFSYDQFKDVEGKDGILDCSARYIHLSLLPNNVATADLTGAIGTVVATKESERLLTAPYVPPLPGDYKELVVLEGSGAIALAASSAMALVAAISLF